MWRVLGQRRSAYRVLVEETLEKELPGRPKCREENPFKLDVKYL
jgi:hypothetical protein